MLIWLFWLGVIGRVYSESCTLEEISAGIALHYKQEVVKIQWVDDSTALITTKEGDFNFPVTSLCARIREDSKNLSGFTRAPPLQESSETPSQEPASPKEEQSSKLGLVALIFGTMACLGLMVVGAVYIFNRCKKRGRRKNPRVVPRVNIDLCSLPTSEATRSEIPDFNSFRSVYGVENRNHTAPSSKPVRPPVPPPSVSISRLENPAESQVCQEASPSSPPVEPKKAENEESVNPSGETEKQANLVWAKGSACVTEIPLDPEKPLTFGNSQEQFLANQQFLARSFRTRITPPYSLYKHPVVSSDSENTENNTSETGTRLASDLSQCCWTDMSEVEIK